MSFNDLLITKGTNNSSGNKETAQQESVLLGLPEDWSSVPSTHIRVLHNHCKSSSRGAGASMRPLGAPAHMWHTLTQIHK